MSTTTPDTQLSLTDSMPACIWSDCEATAQANIESGPVCAEHMDAAKTVKAVDIEVKQEEPETAQRLHQLTEGCRRDGCDSPAGADGLCTACRMETAGDAIGNHGRRL